ncbi:MAG: hypothetical protein U1F50_05070 [Rubrivivax sp.]
MDLAQGQQGQVVVAVALVLVALAKRQRPFEHRLGLAPSEGFAGREGEVVQRIGGDEVVPLGQPQVHRAQQLRLAGFEVEVDGGGTDRIDGQDGDLALAQAFGQFEGLRAVADGRLAVARGPAQVGLNAPGGSQRGAGRQRLEQRERLPVHRLGFAEFQRQREAQGQLAEVARAFDDLARALVHRVQASARRDQFVELVAALAAAGITVEPACHARRIVVDAGDPGMAQRDGVVLRGFLPGAALARFFGGPALQWAGNEVAFADAEGLMRLDRLVLLREGDAAPRWWVIDFKLGTEAAALARYAPQMVRYLAAVRRAQAVAEVRGGFITGDGRFVESAPN